MNPLSRPAAQSDNPDFYGIPKFFSDLMKEAEQKPNDSSDERKTEALPVKMPYNDQELQFIVFAMEIFRPGSNDEKFVYFSSSEEKQQKFNEWMKKRCPSKSFTAEQLELNTIIYSVWLKSKNNVLVDLMVYGTPHLVNTEYDCLSNAASKEAGNRAQINPERVFTYRQAISLFHKAEHLDTKAKL